MVPACVCWAIWRERNLRYHDNITNTCRKLKKIALTCWFFGVKNRYRSSRTVGRFPRINVIMVLACNFLEVASIPLMLKNTTLT